MLRLLGIVVFIVTFSIGFVTYQSVFSEAPPINDVTIDYTFVRTRDSILVTSVTKGEVDADFSASVNKILTNKDKDTGYQIELHMGDIEYESGSNNIYRIFYLPLSTPSGTYCVKTVMRWRPQFSLLDKKITLKHGCFAINDK